MATASKSAALRRTQRIVVICGQPRSAVLTFRWENYSFDDQCFCRTKRRETYNFKLGTSTLCTRG